MTHGMEKAILFDYFLMLEEKKTNELQVTHVLKAFKHI